jgi:hypothetical protein
MTLRSEMFEISIRCAYSTVVPRMDKYQDKWWMQNLRRMHL